MHPRFQPGRDGRLNSSDARQHAWELMAFGPGHADPARRPDRRLLPDLASGPAAARVSPFRRLMARLARILQVAAGGEAAAILAGTLGAPVGKKTQASYIGSDKIDETRHVPLV